MPRRRGRNVACAVERSRIPFAVMLLVATENAPIDSANARCVAVCAKPPPMAMAPAPVALVVPEAATVAPPTAYLRLALPRHHQAHTHQQRRHCRATAGESPKRALPAHKDNAESFAQQARHPAADGPLALLSCIMSWTPCRPEDRFAGRTRRPFESDFCDLPASTVVCALVIWCPQRYNKSILVA